VTTPLSPAAQAVRNAYHEICEDYIETWLNFNHNRGLAAALRALAVRINGADAIRQDILDIATELEGQ
jgi:hypothetical protein